MNNPRKPARRRINAKQKHFAQANKNSVNKTLALLQITRYFQEKQ